MSNGAFWLFEKYKVVFCGQLPMETIAQLVEGPEIFRVFILCSAIQRTIWPRAILHWVPFSMTLPPFHSPKAQVTKRTPSADGTPPLCCTP